MEVSKLNILSLKKSVRQGDPKPRNNLQSECEFVDLGSLRGVKKVTCGIKLLKKQ